VQLFRIGEESMLFFEEKGGTSTASGKQKKTVIHQEAFIKR
jgi:hypothetical protein